MTPTRRYLTITFPQQRAQRPRYLKLIYLVLTTLRLKLLVMDVPGALAKTNSSTQHVIVSIYSYMKFIGSTIDGPVALTRANTVLVHIWVNSCGITTYLLTNNTLVFVLEFGPTVSVRPGTKYISIQSNSGWRDRGAQTAVILKSTSLPTWCPSQASGYKTRNRSDLL